MKKIILSIFTVVVLSGCAVAPLTEEHTARTLGKDNHEWAFGLGYYYYSAAYTRGVTKRLDIGAIAEIQFLSVLAGVKAKYVLAGDPEKSPFSAVIGAGIGSYSKYGYLGLVKSFRVTPRYELALSSRVNVFNWDFNTQEDQDDADDFTHDFIGGVFDLVNGTHTYVSVDISNTYWFTPKFGTTLSVGGISFVGKDSGKNLKGGLKFHFNY